MDDGKKAAFTVYCAFNGQVGVSVILGFLLVE